MRAAAIRAALDRPWRHGQAQDLRGLTIDEPLDLSGLALAGADFTGTRFRAPVTARGARFDGLSWFSGCQFTQADFSGALFVNDARFDGAGFGSAPDFRGAEFRGIARFDDALLPAGGDFRDLVCFGNAAFARVQGDDPDFSGSEFLGGFWAQSAQFGSAARFDGTQVHGRLWLRGALHGNRPLKAADFGMVFGYAWT